MTTRIGYIGFGEVGSTFAKGFAAQGVAAQSAYDIAWADPFLGPTMATRAEAARVTLVATPADLAASADVLFLAVPCAAAAEATGASLPFLGAGHVWVDVTGSSGAAKERRAGAVEARGARFVDAAIMGPVVTGGIRVPILLSGSWAAAFAEGFRPLGMSLDVVSDRAGEASAVKMVRSVFTKGLAALLVEMFVAARRAGVERLVLDSIVQSMEEAPFASTANRYVCALGVHAGRQAAEMREVIGTLEELGVEPVTAEATLKRLQRAADVGLREIFRGIRPAHYGEVLDALERDAGRRSGPV